MNSDPGFVGRNPSSQQQWEASLHIQLLGLESMVVGNIVSRLTRLNKESRQDVDIFDIPTLQARAAYIVDGDPKLADFKSLIQQDLSPQWIQETLIDSGVLHAQIKQFLSEMNSKSYPEKLESIQGLRDNAQALQNRIAEVVPACEELRKLTRPREINDYSVEEYEIVDALAITIDLINKDATQAVNILNGLSRGAGAAQAY